ncbi:MAG: hypothetical protein ACI90V_008023 [Bacillariaceae sp.]|jgi:hypothetical protein
MYSIDKINHFVRRGFGRQKRYGMVCDKTIIAEGINQWKHHRKLLDYNIDASIGQQQYNTKIIL